MNIFVAKLSFDTTSEYLREVFEEYGEVSECTVVLDKFTGKSKGYAFVTMPDGDEARKAIKELNESNLDGKTIIVKATESREIASRTTINQPTFSQNRVNDLNKSREEIFHRPDVEIDPDLVSVMMPFNAELRSTFESIKNVCNDIGLDCKRADDIWNRSTVIQDIYDLIYTSTVVIGDFTGKNPNVFYEIGIAHALGKLVIPIAQSVDDVPFDLRHHRVLRYLPNRQGLEEFEEVLEKRLRVIFENNRGYGNSSYKGRW